MTEKTKREILQVYGYHPHVLDCTNSDTAMSDLFEIDCLMNPTTLIELFIVNCSPQKFLELKDRIEKEQ